MKAMIAVCCKNHTKRTNTLRGQSSVWMCWTKVTRTHAHICSIHSQQRPLDLHTHIQVLPHAYRVQCPCS